MLNQQLTHSLCNILGYENDSNVISAQPLSDYILNVLVWGILLNYEEVSLSFKVSLTHSSEQKSSDGGLISNSCNQQGVFNFNRHFYFFIYSNQFIS